MPTYGYECSACGEQVELFQKITDQPLKECPLCKKQTLTRGIGGGTATLLFKGKGFYKTDYSNSAGNPTNDSTEKTGEKTGCPCKGTHSCTS